MLIFLPRLYCKNPQLKTITIKQEKYFKGTGVNLTSNSWNGRGFQILSTVPFKETVSVISSDPSCKDGNARFTTIPLKPLSDQVFVRYQCFGFFKLFIFICGFSARKWSNGETHKNKRFSSQKKMTISSTFLIRLRF